MTHPAPTRPPQLFCAPNLRCAEVARQLVVLDLSAGVYDVINEVGAAMWAQLTRSPDERNITGLAEKYGVAPATLAADFVDFATAQLAAGRLVTDQRATPRPIERSPRRAPTILRALWERIAAERDLQRGFATAYADRVGPTADTSAPRIAVELLMRRFRTAESLYPARQAPLDCLPRSLALTRFLRTAGWPALHVMGVALYPFEAHAWVELNGTALNEGDLRRFTVIQQA
ncbi:lasso peptide biosynthesis B2 protein [Mycolicibacter senuensis]|uniref:lasso peptide biosynthesis B2 protein n=1 Tax=Mycolicibacter senuensis TaxID=386913 RepID=UPI000DCB4FB1|nr:lasso peptide biosynthesis B2 protein [Mycolicibacter senuensis]RAU99275.1 lasso peptide biosynthesis B2 protein [Mycolicibacter senuensis]